VASVSHIPVWREYGASPLPHSKSEQLQTLIVGGGPVGLTIALDLARNGHQVTLLNRLTFVSAGSKAICFAKRTLEIWDRLGVGDAMVTKGVSWDTAKVFWGDSHDPIYQFDVLATKDQKMPGFINLQQYHVEVILIQALAAMPNVDIRWGHEACGLAVRPDNVMVDVKTQGGTYSITTDWLIACDRSRSSIRELMHLDFEGRVFEDNFLIADIKMKSTRPAERWFWFDPPFNRGQSALLHKQPDDVWRLDFQLGWNIDRDACVQPERVEPYVRALLGPNVQFEREWYSVYTFQCRRMARFVHGRVIFAGDAAHLVSPFGARGCNGGVADADNLAWKLDLVLQRHAPTSLLESYDMEAGVIADANILNSSRSTDFMTPKSVASRALRDAVLELAKDFECARPFVNSGRLSTAVSFPTSPLNTPDEDADWQGAAPGSAATDVKLENGWLLSTLKRPFSVLANRWSFDAVANAHRIDLSHSPKAAERFDLRPGSACVIRPDQVVAARWRRPDREKLLAAIMRATGHQRLAS
jgi:3-(3-hydroxy-phenyl)propionate hydroxylase